MSDRPILFSGPMVRAILDGRKTQTRRVLRTQPAQNEAGLYVLAYRNGGFSQAPEADVPNSYALQRLIPFAVGDRLWVRETLQADRMENLLTGERDTNAIVAYYRADDEPAVEAAGFNLSWVWQRRKLPAIHMPRTFSRLTLVVTDVRVERLQEISVADAEAEGWPAAADRAKTGVAEIRDAYPIGCYAGLWDSLNAKRGCGWSANPWVCAITFEPHHCNIDTMHASEPGPRAEAVRA